MIVLVKHGAGGSTPSLATCYIARRERDAAWEGTAPRKLFSEKEDQLGSFQANQYLGKGEDPEAKDLLHLVINLEKEADFIRLGSNEEARQLSMREAMRATVKQMAADINADELRWVAGIHRNTAIRIFISSFIKLELHAVRETDPAFKSRLYLNSRKSNGTYC